MSKVNASMIHAAVSLTAASYIRLKDFNPKDHGRDLVRTTTTPGLKFEGIDENGDGCWLIQKPDQVDKFKELVLERDSSAVFEESTDKPKYE